MQLVPTESSLAVAPSAQHPCVDCAQVAAGGKEEIVYIQSGDTCTGPATAVAHTTRTVTAPLNGTVYAADTVFTSRCPEQLGAAVVASMLPMPHAPVPALATASMRYWPLCPDRSKPAVSPALSVPPQSIGLPPLVSRRDALADSCTVRPMIVDPAVMAREHSRLSGYACDGRASSSRSAATRSIASVCGNGAAAHAACRRIVAPDARAPPPPSLGMR